MHRRRPTRNRRTDPRHTVGRLAPPTTPPSTSPTPRTGAPAGAPGEPPVGSRSAVTRDLGQGVGAVTTLSSGGASDSGQRAGPAFGESSLCMGADSDKSGGRDGEDGALYDGSAPAPGTYTVPMTQLRGGTRYLNPGESRYLTVLPDSSGRVDPSGAGLDFTAAPGKSDPADHANRFHSGDDLPNRIRYAGPRYSGPRTARFDTTASGQGRAWPPPSPAWDHSATVGPESTADGYTACADAGDSGGSCCAGGFGGARTVAPGAARRRLLHKSFLGGVACTTAAFGAGPLPDGAKSRHRTT